MATLNPPKSHEPKPHEKEDGIDPDDAMLEEPKDDAFKSGGTGRKKQDQETQFDSGEEDTANVSE